MLKNNKFSPKYVYVLDVIGWSDGYRDETHVYLDEASCIKAFKEIYGEFVLNWIFADYEECDYDEDDYDEEYEDSSIHTTDDLDDISAQIEAQRQQHEDDMLRQALEAYQEASERGGLRHSQYWFRVMKKYVE